MEGIGETYVINMDSATKRMEDMARQCEDLGISYVRIPAVDGRKVSPKVLGKVATPRCRTMCTPSTIGCALSHMRVWKAVLESGHDRVLVMEDDAVLVPDFKERLEQALRDAPPDFDVLVCGCFGFCKIDRKYSLGHTIMRTWSRFGMRDDTRTWGSVFVPESFSGTHCYVVSKQGCANMLKYIPLVNSHIDGDMNHPKIKLYAVSPDLALQRDMSDSSIASYGFPKTLVPLLDKWKDEKRISVAYYMDGPMFQVAGQPVNLWAFAFLAIGVLFRQHAVPYVAGVMLAEILFGGRILVPSVSFLLGWGLTAGVVKGYKVVS